MKYLLTIVFGVFISFSPLFSQTNNNMDSNVPYKEIPSYPEKYSSGNVLARTIDGLGYRFYWASEGLRPEDLTYKPSEDSRTTEDTMEHMYGLSLMILQAAKNEPNIRPLDLPDHNFEDRRAAILQNIKKASDLFKNMKKRDLKKRNIIFKRGEKTSDFPLWNLLNGPLADAIYHTGQIVAYRRASGNPLNPNVNVFMGKNRTPK